MLNYALHATTQNRDRDPADGTPVDFAAFDSGPEYTGSASGTDVAADGGTERGN
jgi:glycerol-3-phosphate dehydrogenase